MANIDLKQAATKGYVEGDEYLTKDSSGGLNWTPAHEAPYELLENDISSGTSTKGLVSGEQLAALGGGAVKTILLRDDGAGGSTWQHLISSADLTGGDDFIFILGSSSAADLNVVCIPTEASVPELANISELKLVVYGGSGKSGFSENFNGVGTGAQVLGTEGVVGSGCVIARKVGVDAWYLSYEVTKPSGPEVLKDWVTISGASNLFAGTDLATARLDNVIIEFRNVYCNNGGGGPSFDGNLSLRFRNTGNTDTTGSSSGNSSVSRLQSSTATRSFITDAHILMQASFGYTASVATVRLIENAENKVRGYSSDSLAASDAPSLGINQINTVASFWNLKAEPIMPELWVRPPTGTTEFVADYRIIRKN